MYRGAPFSNKHVKRRQEEKYMDYHKINLHNMRPVTGTLEKDDGVVLNNRKGEMQKETRFTQIERQNRILLEKISSIMSKTKNKFPLPNNQKHNKSLNSSFRRRQHQNIEIQNAKLLKRLQQKKPNYNTEKLKQDWKKQKYVIKNLSNYPFILNDRKRITGHGKRSISIVGVGDQGKQNIEMCRIRVIDGTSFLITVKMTPVKLQIIGDCKDKKEMKVIEIQRGEAIEFLEQECKGRIQNIFDRLRYDKEDEVLYLVGTDVELEDIDQNKKPPFFEEQFNEDGPEQKQQERKLTEKSEKSLKKELQIQNQEELVEETKQEKKQLEIAQKNNSEKDGQVEEINELNKDDIRQNQDNQAKLEEKKQEKFEKQQQALIQVKDNEEKKDEYKEVIKNEEIHDSVQVGNKNENQQQKKEESEGQQKIEQKQQQKIIKEKKQSEVEDRVASEKQQIQK